MTHLNCSRHHTLSYLTTFENAKPDQDHHLQRQAHYLEELFRLGAMAETPSVLDKSGDLPHQLPKQKTYRVRDQLQLKFPGALPPFPRSTWIHPHVPYDNFDHACKNIWRRAEEARREFGRGHHPPESPHNKGGAPPERNHWTEEQQKETDDLGLKYHTEFSLPCPYLSGDRHPHVAKPVRALSPVMEVEMKPNEGQAERKRNLGGDMECKQRRVEKSFLQSIRRTDKHSAAPEAGPLTINPICSAAEDPAPHLHEDKSVIRRFAHNNLNFLTIPVLRPCKPDSSSDSNKDLPLCTIKNNLPRLLNIKACILPCPTETPASRKLCDAHDNPTATLQRGMTAPVMAPVQGRAEAPQGNTKTNAPTAALTQQEAYDLLANFPALERPKKPLGLDMQGGNPKMRIEMGQSGLTHPPKHCPSSGASHQRRMGNVSHEVSSISAGEEKYVLSLHYPTNNCGHLTNLNQRPPRVAAAHGMDVHARSWASAVKAGMTQAAAPQEKGRLCTFQQVDTNNRAKARHSLAQSFSKRVTPSHQLTSLWRGPQTCNPNWFARVDYPPNHWHCGVWAHRADCPPRFRCPCSTFQQEAVAEVWEETEREKLQQPPRDTVINAMMLML
ncbi:uncharacterized protein LOC118292282 isoform X2 [Scophthalmus maximus]|uniref:uncharacterized protein LOC118292282 isoform X2 n=1 Tax=Scophthalmus maximus TaxID=52904 RepID=UPI0015E0F253|nr:uncharacterized protein LOC118292282 isoform X2 [Scophthalmus maximus]